MQSANFSFFLIFIYVHIYIYFFFVLIFYILKNDEFFLHNGALFISFYQFFLLQNKFGGSSTSLSPYILPNLRISLTVIKLTSPDMRVMLPLTFIGKSFAPMRRNIHVHETLQISDKIYEIYIWNCEKWAVALSSRCDLDVL